MNNKLRLLYVVETIKNTDSLSPMNATQIIDYLRNEYEIICKDTDTIRSDIDSLISSGFPIVQCDDKKKGWYYDGHEFENWELKLIIDAVSHAKCISVDGTRKLIKKLKKSSSQRSRTKLSRLYEHLIPSKVTSDYPNEFVEIIIEAIYQLKKIEFCYSELDSKFNRREKNRSYLLSPYDIVWSGSTFYLIGCLDNHDNPTHFRVDRITRLKMTDESLVSAEEKLGTNAESKIRELIDKSVYFFTGKPIDLVIDYQPNTISNNILFDLFGSQIQVLQEENGVSRISVKTADSPTLIGWLVQHSDKFKVIEPLCVVESIKKKIINTCNLYKM